MNELYFTVSSVAKEIQIGLPRGEYFHVFKILFAESEISKDRAVMIMANCDENLFFKTEALFAERKKDCDNEFEFKYDTEGDFKIRFNIFWENDRKIVVLRY